MVSPILDLILDRSKKKNSKSLDKVRVSLNTPLLRGWASRKKLVIYCCITNHLKTQQHKIMIYYYHSWFCRLPGLSWEALPWSLSCGCNLGLESSEDSLGWMLR